MWKASVDESTLFIDGGKLPCVLVANKIDLVAKETATTIEADLKKFGQKNDFNKTFVCSAKDNYNIEESISYLITVVIKRLNDMKGNDNNEDEEDYNNNKNTLTLTAEKARKKSNKKENDGCC